MKGARRTRKPRHQAGFADLMAPTHPHTGARGIVTGVSRAQSTVSTSTPTTPTPTAPNPTTPPPLEEDWGALLQTTPKRRMSPQKPIIAASPNSASSTPLSPVKPAPAPATPVPAFLSGWDGADGWRDEPSLDDSDQDVQEDTWGVWPETDPLFSSEPQLTANPPAESEEQHPAPEPALKTAGMTGLSSEQPPASIEIFHDDQTPQVVTLHEPPGEAADSEGLKASTHDHPRNSTVDEGPDKLEDAVEVSGQPETKQMLPEDKPLERATNSAPEQPQEDSPHHESVSGGDKPDTVLEAIDFSGWNDMEVAQEDQTDFLIPENSHIRSRQETTTEESRPHYEGREDEALQLHASQKQVDPSAQAETNGVEAGRAGVAESDAEVVQDTEASTSSTVYPTDMPHHPPPVQLAMDAWGFEQTSEEVPANDSGWGLGETDNAPTSIIGDNEGTQVSSGAKTKVIPNEFASDSLKGNSATMNLASEERITGHMIMDDVPPTPGEHEEAKLKNDVDINASLPPSTAPEDSWGFGEDSGETVTDDWGWGQSDQNQVEFTFDVDSSVSKAKTPPSTPPHDPSIQESAYDSLQPTRQTAQQPLGGDDTREERSKSAGDGTVEKMSDQKSHGMKSAYDDTSFRPPVTTETGTASAVDVQQSGCATHEPYGSFPVVRDSGHNQHHREDVTLDQGGFDTKDFQQPPLESLTVEEDACGVDVRSTDVDASSTAAGTVPSVAAPSSVDETEWEGDRNELRLNPSNTPDVIQDLDEKLKPAASGMTSSFAWSGHHTSQTDRSWANPDVMWAAPHAVPQALVASEERVTPVSLVGQEAPTEKMYVGKETVPLRGPAAAKATGSGISEASLSQANKDTSLSGSAPAHSHVEFERFQYRPQDHNAGKTPAVANTSYVAEIQTAAMPEQVAAPEFRSTSEELGSIGMENAGEVRSAPQAELPAVSDKNGSSFSPTGFSAKTYWNERLDQSSSKELGGSSDRVHATSADFLEAKPDEIQMTAPNAAPDGITVAWDNATEKDDRNVQSNTNSAKAPGEPIGHQTGSFVVSSPSGVRDSHARPEPATQLGPAWGSPLESNGAANETVQLAAPVLDARAESFCVDISKSTETRIENGPASGDGSQSVQTTQGLQWPDERLAFTDDDGSSYFKTTPGGFNIEDNRNVEPDASQEPVLEQSKTTLPLDGSNNGLSEWNQYAPPPTSSAHGPTPDSVSGVSPAPLVYPSSERQQGSLSGTQAISHDMGSYDPFSVGHEDTGKASSEAFDWNIGVQEQVRDAEFSVPTVSAAPETHTDQEAHTLSDPRPEETMTVPNAAQVIPSQKKNIEDSSALNVIQDPQSMEDAEAVRDFEQGFTGRQVQSSEEERSIMPESHIQAGSIEHVGEEYTIGGHLKARKSHEDVVHQASESQPSPHDAVGLAQYAPRDDQRAELGGGVPMHNPPLIRQEPFDASASYGNGDNFPPITAASGLIAPDAPYPGGYPVSSQFLQPQLPPSFEAEVSKAAREPPVQTSTPSTRTDVQFYQRERRVSSPSYMDSAPLHADRLSMTKPPVPETPDTAKATETPDLTTPSTTVSEGRSLSQSRTGYQGELQVHGSSNLSYDPVQNESSPQISHEGVHETPDFKQQSLSMYGMEDNPSSLSAPSQTGPSPYPPLSAYENVPGPLPSHGQIDVPALKDTSQGQGSYGTTDGFTLGFAVPPPPQQVPPPPPSIPADQEVFQGESILDPSSFSYPYSIMDTETTGDLSYRPQRPLISWGFGGKLVTVIPPMSSALGNGRMPTEVTGSSTIHIHDLTAIAQDGSNDDWAAAWEAVSPLPLPVPPPDLLIYADMCDRLSKLSAGLSGSESEGRAAMWRVLALLCRQGTSNWRINAATAICGPSSVPMFGRTNNASLLSGKAKVESPLRECSLASRMSEHDKDEAAAEVERLLTVGNGVEAIRAAQEAGLWSIALVLAATIDKSLYMRALSEFAKSTLQDGSALQTLCLSTAEDEAEILRKATSSCGLKEWRKTVGMLLTTSRAATNTGEVQHSKFLRLIDQIGEALVSQKNDIVAGHVCFLLSGRLGPLDRSNIPLLGADSKQPAGRPRSMGSPAVVLQSLVFEAVANVQSGAMYPHILPHRLLLAEEVCSVGKPEVALAQCESIASAVKEVFESGRQDIWSEFFTLPFLSRLESLEQRLRVHLGLQESGAKKAGLSALGKSLSSVFTRSLSADSKGVKPTSRSTSEAQSSTFADSQRTTKIQAAQFTSAPPQPPAVSSVNRPHEVAEPQWTPSFDHSHLKPLPDEYSQSVERDRQSGDVSGNQRWNSLVSKTIGFIAPAEGDLSPPLKARGDQGVPLHAQPTPLGLGTGTGSRAPSHGVQVGHVRSASVGDVPLMQSHGPMMHAHGQGTYSHQPLHDPPQSQAGNLLDVGGRPADRTTFSGTPVQKATTPEANSAPTHRRSASDITYESQTSEKKPPRPPKKSSALPPSAVLQAKKEKEPAIKGWRSRLSEKIRAAFSGPPRAHMGVENKFRYDKDRGRWIIEGEDPDEADDIPPPPPDDDAMNGGNGKVPFSQSYESLPNPDLGNQFLPNPQVANSNKVDGLPEGSTGAGHSRRYSYDAQFAYNGSPENANPRDTGSESSVASAASAPVPYSSQPGIPMSTTAGNKFRARPGRQSGRRAYVDTFNKGSPVSSKSAALPATARPGIPSMPGLGSSGGGGYRIFTPSPAVASERLSTMDSSVGEEDIRPEASSTLHSSDQVHQTQATNGQQPGDTFGYGLSKPAPMPSVEEYRARTRNESQRRLMA